MKLSTLLKICLSILSTAVPAMAIALNGDKFTDGQYEYMVVDEGNKAVQIKKCLDAEKTASKSIPANVLYNNETYKVTELGREVFSGWRNLSVIYLPESIKWIGEGAFRGCLLEEIHIDSDVPPVFIPEDVSYDLTIEKFNIRDPFILADRNSYKYYAYKPQWSNGHPWIELYESYDMRRWKNIGSAWDAEDGFLGNNDNWAPDTYEFQGNHYIFVTFSRIYDTANGDHWNRSNFEISPGITILKSSDGATGPYKFVAPANGNRLNVTRQDMTIIDGSLFIDSNGQPWMIYSGELCQYYDGRVYAQKMNSDLSCMIGDPILLFTASESGWSYNSGYRDGQLVYITDAPYVIRDPESGSLILIWSSGGINGYTMGQAISESGNILGPWKHVRTPLNTDDGGHGHIFTDFDGRRMLSYHTTDSQKSDCHMAIHEVTISNGQLNTFDKKDYTVKSIYASPSFDSKILNTAKIFVPEGCTSKYINDDLWGRFKSIVENSGINESYVSTAKPFEIKGNEIWLNDTDTSVKILALDGRIMELIEGASTKHKTLPYKGMYIVSSGEYNVKVVF